MYASIQEIKFNAMHAICIVPYQTQNPYVSQRNLKGKDRTGKRRQLGPRSAIAHKGVHGSIAVERRRCRKAYTLGCRNADDGDVVNFHVDLGLRHIINKSKKKKN